MSKGFKTGLDYFPLDVDFFDDEKISFITARFGLVGENIAIKLLTRVYRNGYFFPWGEDECLLFSLKLGGQVPVETINAVISELVKRDFFSKEKFFKYKILTSRGIQSRYLEATKRRGRVEMIKPYLIADISGFNVNILELNVDIMSTSPPQNVDGNPQRKGKERKEVKLFLSDSEEIRLSELLFALISDRDPKAKKPNIQKWADPIDKLRRVDNRSVQDIEDVINWCQNDSFWQNNILSTNKLRDKFSQLILKMNGNGSSPSRPYAKAPPPVNLSEDIVRHK